MRVSSDASMRSTGVASFHLSRRHHDATVAAFSFRWRAIDAMRQPCQ
jgi:hypothetical protein